MSAADSLDLAREATRRWLMQGVLRHTLCPFAAAPVARDGVHIQGAEAKTLESAAADAVLAGHALLDHADTDTSLVVFPFALDDFDDFLDMVAACEAYLEERDLSSELQLATFHPEYRFDGVPADAASNYTNRSPLPILQWLRVSQVSEGVDAHPDAESIPDRNIALMESLGAEEREALRSLPGTRIVPGTRARWESGEWAHYVVKKARVTFGRGGIASTRRFGAGTLIDATDWALHIRSGEVLSRS